MQGAVISYARSWMAALSCPKLVCRAYRFCLAFQPYRQPQGACCPRHCSPLSPKFRPNSLPHLGRTRLDLLRGLEPPALSRESRVEGASRVCWGVGQFLFLCKGGYGYGVNEERERERERERHTQNKTQRVIPDIVGVPEYLQWFPVLRTRRCAVGGRFGLRAREAKRLLGHEGGQKKRIWG